MSYSPIDSPLYQLLQNGKTTRIPKGQHVFFDTERSLMGVLIKGYVKRYILTQDGSESIQVIYGPGDLFPLTTIYNRIFNFEINDVDKVTYYRSMTAAELCTVDAVTLDQALIDNPLIYKDLLFNAGVRLSSNIKRLDNISLKVANRRVAHMLLHFAKKFGEQTGEGTRILVPLTQDDIAATLNLARETVTIALARLREKGLLNTGRNIVIFDLDALQREIR